MKDGGKIVAAGVSPASGSSKSECLLLTFSRVSVCSKLQTDSLKKVGSRGRSQMKEELDEGSIGTSWLVSRRPLLSMYYAGNRDSVSISFITI